MPETADMIAEAFHRARQDGVALADYPGEVPKDLAAAYTIQERAIGLWPDQVVGWKVAMVAEPWRAAYPTADRISGPVFSKRLVSSITGPAQLKAFPGGFIAVEAEFVVRIGRDIPADATFAKADDLLPYVAGVHAGIELAASPLASLNDLGPGAVVSDFGNNSGVIIGDEITSFADGGLEAEVSSMAVNGQEVGTGSAARIPGGPLEAVRYLHAHLAERGRTLKAGDWVSTGASTGIHRTEIGASCKAVFKGGASASLTIL